MAQSSTSHSQSGKFSGVFTALVTPFKNGDIDWVSLKRLLRSQLDGGVSGLVVNGTTAESPTLSELERADIFKFVRGEVGQSFPLVMGTGTNSTLETINQTKIAESLGADGVLVVVPYYNKPPQRGLFAHFQKVAESTKLPVILYNVPSRTITRLEHQTVVELSKLKNIIGIKDASGDIELGANLIRECGPDFMVSSGDDGTFLDLVAVGGGGVISVASNMVPKKFANWSKRAMAGDTSARIEFAEFSDLNSYLYVEANPIPIKMALHLMGLIDSPELRLPMAPLSEPFTAQLKEKMLQAGLL